MASSLPSPPQFNLPAPPPLALPPGQTAQLRSSTGQVLVALEELQRLVAWGDAAGIVGWPTILASYQRLLSLLAVLNHHLAPASSTGRHASSSTTTPLSQLVVHPTGLADQASEAWLQALLAIPTSDHLRAPPPPGQGTPEEHEARRTRALKVCELLGEEHDWRGRVGLVAPGAEDGGSDDDDDDDVEDDDDDEGLFGEKKGKKGDQEMKGVIAAAAPLPPPRTAEEQAKELSSLLSFLSRGPAPDP